MKWNWNWKEWLKAALIRAIRTFAQTFVSMIAVGAAFSEVEWLRVVSVSGLSFVLSLATSLTGIPEVETKPPAENNDNQDTNIPLQGQRGSF